jgi:tyrocidine synthetase-3
MTVKLFSEDKIIASNQFIKEKKYWMNKFSGDLVLSYFPYDYPKQRRTEKVFDSTTFKLFEDVFARFEKIAGDSNPKSHIVLTAGLTALLYKYTGNQDVIIGTPIDKQDIETEFTNTVLALRIQLHDNMTFKELILHTRQTIIEAIENQNYPIEALLNHLNMKSSDDDLPLFDAALLLENIHIKNYLHQVKPNIIFSFMRTRECIEGAVEYNSQLYDKVTIERIIKHFLYLLHTAIANMDIRLSRISLLTQEEERELIFNFNNTDADYPRNKTIHKLFEEQGEKTPDKISVKEAGTSRSMTYGELHIQSSRLAQIFMKRGVTPGTIVGLMTERSIEMLVAIFGILKAEAAYLPIEPSYPQERIDYMLKDSRAKLLVTNNNLEEARKLGSEEAQTGSSLFPTTGNRQPGTSVAYIIYTSGSTGKPKGVMVEHRGLVNYIWWAAKKYVKNENVNFALYTSIAFDLTVTSIFTPLITGQTIIVYKEEGVNSRFLIEKVIEDKIEVVKLTPSHLKLIRNQKINSNPPAPQRDSQVSIKRFIVGGEELDTQLAMDIYTNFNENIEIYNEYGPTEAVVGCMIFKFNPLIDKRKSVSIGLPADNVKIYILDRYLRLLPIGVTGELYISGDGLARGYLNNPELTAEKFICFAQKLHELNEYNNTLEQVSLLPALTRITKPIYKTGDLAARLSDGNIEFLGRIDHQVKIRGFRIELGEIENCLTQYPEIKDVLVIFKKSEKGYNYLCAYFVSDHEIPVSELKEYLSKRLPDYMIPSYFVKMEKIPLTSNGKIDQKALPEPELKAGENYTAPGTEVEKKLVELWAEVLSRGASQASQLQKSIGINDNFFELGGQSLTATILVSKIHKALNVKISLVDLFKTPTIRGLAGYLSGSLENKFISLEAVEKKEYYPLSSPQKRLYLIQQMDLKGTTYNIPEMYISEEEINKNRLIKIFKKLLERHESLRTSFALVGGQPVQHVHDHVELEIEYYSISKIEAKEEAEELRKTIKAFIRPFDLSRAPLMRVGLLKAAENKHLLMIDMHHIITDGVSHSILAKDFIIFYSGAEQPALRLHYKDFTIWQNNLISSGEIKKQEQYWLKEFAEDLPVLNLPMDYVRHETQSFAGDSIQFEISSSESSVLRDFSKNENATLFMVLLAIYNVLLSKLSGQEDIVVGVGTAGRRHADLEKIIGMFVNTLALRNYPVEEKTFKEFFREVSVRTLQAFENQDYLFEDLVEKVVKKRDLNRNPLFDTVFMVQNLGDEAVDTSIIEKFTLTLKPYHQKSGISQFDMFWGCTEVDKGLRFSVTYRTKLFERETIERYISYFKQIVSEVTDNIEIKIKAILTSIHLLKSQSYDDEMELGFEIKLN